MLERFKTRARNLRRETYALYLAARHPRTPWYAKLLVAAVVAYALSPIDLIPDFIPVLGYVDDLILIPLGVAIAVKLIPSEVLSECRARANAAAVRGKPISRTAAAVIVGIWLLIAALCMLWAYEALAMSARVAAAPGFVTPPAVVASRLAARALRCWPSAAPMTSRSS